MTGRNTHNADAPTALQRAILDFVSQHGPATAEQIREGLLPAHRLKDSSVRTLLRRLEARGYVSHRVDGKVFVYRTVVASRGVAARAVRRLIEGFWGGSTEAFLAGLVDEEVLSADEIQRLARKVRGRR